MHEHRPEHPPTSRRASRWCAGLLVLGALLLGGPSPAQAATQHAALSTVLHTQAHQKPACDSGWNGT